MRGETNLEEEASCLRGIHDVVQPSSVDARSLSFVCGCVFWSLQRMRKLPCRMRQLKEAYECVVKFDVQPTLRTSRCTRFSNLVFPLVSNG